MTIRGKWSIALLSVLVVSVALNLFVAGFAASRFQQFRHGSGPGIERMFGAFMKRFPREIRRAVHDELQEVRPEFKAAIESMRGARTDMFEIMRGDPLDKGALEQAMAHVRTQTNNVHQIAQEAVRMAIENSNPEARSQIDSQGSRWRRHHRWD